MGKDWSAPCRNSVYAPTGSVSYADKANPAVGAFLSDFAKYGRGATMHQWTLEGYGNAMWFADGVKSMGANPTREGLINYLDSVKGYTAGGLFAPRDFQVVDETKPQQECNTIVQWQDSAATYVTRAPVTYCVMKQPIPYQPSDDGA